MNKNKGEEMNIGFNSIIERCKTIGDLQDLENEYTQVNKGGKNESRIQ